MDTWTSSIIKFVPKPEDNGKYIVCKATNEFFPNHIKEDGYIINVHCEYIPSAKNIYVVFYLNCRSGTGLGYSIKSFIKTKEAVSICR